jgi:transposase
MSQSDQAAVVVPPAQRVALPTAAACSAPALPEGPCPVCPRLAEQFEPYRQAAFWKSMHQKALARQAELQAENDALRAQLRLREQQLFGTKAESRPARTGAHARPGAEATPGARRPRGQQPGRPSPPRRDHSHLPAVEEVIDLPDDQRRCPCCGLPFDEFPGTDDGQVLEVQVKAYRRVYRRRRYRPACSCGAGTGVITAPAPDKVIPRGTLGVSIWVEVLLDKYLFYRPTYRLLQDWATRGLDLPLGTLTDGLRRLAPLFQPVYAALVEHNRRQAHWHADETRWLVFATVEGKVGHRWVLWVFHSEQAAVFVLDSGRAHDVPEGHLGPVEEGVLSADRYSAYKAMRQVKAGLILLAFCWAHVRRDFLDVARCWPGEEGWALGWVQRIGQLYRLNDARLEAGEEPAAYAGRDEQVRQHVRGMKDRAEAELSAPGVHPARRKVLASLQEHWDGLTVFVEHPEVPLDNNTAERALRGPVVGRKNYRGSGAVWSGELAAMLFSVFQTLCLWDINPRLWLEAYLAGCARAGGEAPPDLSDYLPWRMTEARRKEWSSEPGAPADDSS